MGFKFSLALKTLCAQLVADPLIDVSPSEISLGVTSALEINCTFSLDNHPDMAACISLVLSRANATGQNFEDLAAITEFSPNSVNILTQEKVSATGVHSDAGESFLHLTWQYPTALQAGVYKCSALGVGIIGHNIEITNTSLVTLHQANLNDVFDKLQQLEMHESSMEKHITNLERNISRMEVVVASITGPHVNFIGSHGNKDYYVSSYDFTNINESIKVCKSLGGQLAVIDNQDEFTAVKGFLYATLGVWWVYISGSDEKTEGNWVLSDSDTPLPFTSWMPGGPHTDRKWNCLSLFLFSSWSMDDLPCIQGPASNTFRFLCEI